MMIFYDREVDAFIFSNLNKTHYLKNHCINFNELKEFNVSEKSKSLFGPTK